MTSAEKPIAHHILVDNLLQAILLPTQIAVCKCQAYTNADDPVSLGNNIADAAAKAAATSFVSPTLLMVSMSKPFALHDISLLQTGADTWEKKTWSKHCILNTKVLY